MGYQIWCIVFVLLSVLSSSFVCGNVFKDFGSNGIPMSSPINVNDQKMEYLDALPSESFTEYVVLYLWLSLVLWYTFILFPIE